MRKYQNSLAILLIQKASKLKRNAGILEQLPSLDFPSLTVFGLLLSNDNHAVDRRLMAIILEKMPKLEKSGYKNGLSVFES